MRRAEGIEVWVEEEKEKKAGAKPAHRYYMIQYELLFFRYGNAFDGVAGKGGVGLRVPAGDAIDNIHPTDDLAEDGVVIL